MAKLKNNLEKLLMQYYGVDTPKKLPSQQVIANEFGLSQTTISRWLSEKVDRFDADVLEKFCIKLKCNVGDLVYLEF